MILRRAHGVGDFGLLMCQDGQRREQQCGEEQGGVERVLIWKCVVWRGRA